MAYQIWGKLHQQVDHEGRVVRATGADGKSVVVKIGLIDTRAPNWLQGKHGGPGTRHRLEKGGWVLLDDLGEKSEMEALVIYAERKGDPREWRVPHEAGGALFR